MSTRDSIPRRWFLELGVGAALSFGLGLPFGGERRAFAKGRQREEEDAAGARLHPALHGGRAEPARHLRSQAGPPHRRPVQGDRDQRQGHPHLRAPAAPREADEAHGAHPLADQQGRQPRSRAPPDAHRLPSAGRRRPPRVRLDRRAHARLALAARLRRHRRSRRGRRLPRCLVLAVPGAGSDQADAQPRLRRRRRPGALRHAARPVAHAAGRLRHRPPRRARRAASARWASRRSRSCARPASPRSTSPPSPTR